MKSVIDDSVQLQAHLALGSVKHSQDAILRQFHRPPRVTLAIYALCWGVSSFVNHTQMLDTNQKIIAWIVIALAGWAAYLWDVRQSKVQLKNRPKISRWKLAVLAVAIALWSVAGTNLIHLFGETMNWIWAGLTVVVFFVVTKFQPIRNDDPAPFAKGALVASSTSDRRNRK